MIRNIIFDLGNVLISFKPEEFLKSGKYPEEFTERALNDVFHSKEWLQLDNGDISLSDAIRSISLKSSLNSEEITGIFNLRTRIMFSLDHNVKILPELKKRGFSLYYLSNFPSDIFPDIKNANSFFEYFDGGIISADVRFSKPQKRIYEILIEKYSLLPEESVFIDDIKINVEAALLTGMHGIHLPNSYDLKTQLENFLLQEL